VRQLLQPNLMPDVSDDSLGAYLADLIGTTNPSPDYPNWIGLFPALLMNNVIENSQVRDQDDIFTLKIRYNIRCAECQIRESVVAQHDWVCTVMDNRRIAKERRSTVQRLPGAALEQMASDLDKGLSHPWFSFSEDAQVKCSCPNKVRLIDRFVVDDVSHCVWIHVDQRDSSQVYKYWNFPMISNSQ
jgi:hypothetical protein